MLRNSWGRGVSNFPEINVTKVYGSMLLALQGGGWVALNFPEKKHYVTLEWLLEKDYRWICKMYCNDSPYSSANATPKFEGRGGEELATEISTFLSRAYSNLNCLDLKSLCVVPRLHTWILYIDVLVRMCGVHDRR